MTAKEEPMGREVPADIFFRKTGAQYRATPPVFNVHLASKPNVLIRNLTGDEVIVWAPQDVLLGTPHSLASGTEYSFAVNDKLDAGTYVYTAWVVGTDQFVEGNSPPAIIIDK